MQPVIYHNAAGRVRESIWGRGWKLAKLPNSRIYQNAEIIRSQIEAHPELKLEWQFSVGWEALEGIVESIRWQNKAFLENDALLWDHLKAAFGNAKVTKSGTTKLLEDPEDPSNKLSAQKAVHVFVTYFYFLDLPSTPARDEFEMWLEGWVERWIEHLYAAESKPSNEGVSWYVKAALPSEDHQKLAEELQRWVERGV